MNSKTKINKTKISTTALLKLLKKLHLRVSKIKNDLKGKLSNLKATNLDLGIYHYYNNNLFDAMMRFKLILKFCPDSKQAMHYLGCCMIKKGEFEKAIPLLQYAGESIDNGFQLNKFRVEDINSTLDSVPFQIKKDMLDSRDIYNINNPDKRNKLRNFIVESILNAKPDLIKMDVLDLNCGNGWIAQGIKAMVTQSNVTGITRNMMTINYCNMLNIKNNKLYNTLLYTDWNDFIINTDRKYDIIIADIILSFSNDIAKNIRLISDKLNSEGVMFISLMKGDDDQEIALDPISDMFHFSDKVIKLIAERNNLEILMFANRDNSIRIPRENTYCIFRKRQTTS